MRESIQMAHTTQRALALLSLLQTHRNWTGTELAQRLDVTARTLRRDVERLRQLGYRIDGSRGVAGGYRLEAGSQLPPLLLNDDEAVTMAIGLRVAATQGLVDGEHTTLSALAKFEQVLPSSLRSRVNAVAGFVQSPAPRGEPVSSDVLGKLALACRDREQIRLHYTAANGEETDRRVEPHSLVAAQRNWFLVCWDVGRDDWRTLRVDRISRFSGTAVRFAGRELPSTDAAEFVAAAVATMRSPLRAEVTVRAPIATVRERLGSWGREAVAIDDVTTLWPVSGTSLAVMLSALLWIPEEFEYELHGSPEFLAYVAAATERLRSALPI